MASKKNVLFVFTSASKTLTGSQTGWYLPEVAHPYYVLLPHHNITFAAPAGPNPPVDEYSVKTYTDEESVRFLNDPTVKEKLDTALKLSEVKVEDYDAIFYPGGHGPVLDLPTDETNIKLASAFFQANKITSAVCHGPAALVNAVDSNGVSIFKGRRASAFTNEEEAIVKGEKLVPFLVESRIIENGGTFEKTEPWGVKVVVDGHLITGQNPSSAKGVGEAILQALA